MRVGVSLTLQSLDNKRPVARHLQKADDEGYYDRSDCQGHDNSGKEKISNPVIRP